MNKLVLLRHGQSQWNKENRFTGWKDVDLSSNGILEAKNSGKLIKLNSIKIEKIYSSNLIRANKTASIAMREAGYDHLFKNDKLVMIKNESLNERDYGELTGLNKLETANKFGKEQVHIWRRSFDIKPPGGESLKDVVHRVSSYFENVISLDLKQNKNILISAHGNSLRALFFILDFYDTKSISKLEIPTGKPFIIEYEKDKITNKYYL
mgnify:CR=1 FL=1